jgi:hypothetical protein
MSTQILAAGTTAANSADVVLDQGETATLALFVAAGSIPAQPACTIFLKGQGAPVAVSYLDRARPAASVQGPGTYFVQRPAMAVAVGVDSRS